MATVTTPAKLTPVDIRCDLRARPPVSSKNKSSRTVELIPWWRTDITGNCSGQEFWNIDRSGAFNGSVLDGSIPVPYALVRLYYKPNGLLIGRATCTIAGTFLFKGLDKASADYFAVAHYPNDNAQIYDKLTPA